MLLSSIKSPDFAVTQRLEYTRSTFPHTRALLHHLISWWIWHILEETEGNVEFLQVFWMTSIAEKVRKIAGSEDLVSKKVLCS